MKCLLKLRDIDVPDTGSGVVPHVPDKDISGASLVTVLWTASLSDWFSGNPVISDCVCLSIGMVLGYMLLLVCWLRIENRVSSKRMAPERDIMVKNKWSLASLIFISSQVHIFSVHLPQWRPFPFGFLLEKLSGAIFSELTQYAN